MRAAGRKVKPVELPVLQSNGGKPSMQVLKERRSVRDFGPEQLSRQILSNLLGAAGGVNRNDSRRTAPSSSNQEMDAYVIMADGACLYDAAANGLKPVAQTDIRKLAGTQAYAAEAPVNLVYLADTAKFGGYDRARLATANVDTGFISQNVYLFCASEGLGTVVRGSVDPGRFGKGPAPAHRTADHQGKVWATPKARRRLIRASGITGLFVEGGNQRLYLHRSVVGVDVQEP